MVFLMFLRIYPSVFVKGSTVQTDWIRLSVAASHVHLLFSGSGVRSEVTCGLSSATVWGSCGASATTTQPGSTRGATEEASFRDWPAAQTTFTRRQTSRVSTSMRTRGGTLWPATPTGNCSEQHLGWRIYLSGNKMWLIGPQRSALCRNPTTGAGAAKLWAAVRLWI